MTPLSTSGWQLDPGQADADADARAPLDGGGQLKLAFLTPTMARVTWETAQGYKAAHLGHQPGGRAGCAVDRTRPCQSLSLIHI